MIIQKQSTQYVFTLLLVVLELILFSNYKFMHLFIEFISNASIYHHSLLEINFYKVTILLLTIFPVVYKYWKPYRYITLMLCFAVVLQIELNLISYLISQFSGDLYWHEFKFYFLIAACLIFLICSIIFPSYYGFTKRDIIRVNLLIFISCLLSSLHLVLMTSKLLS